MQEILTFFIIAAALFYLCRMFWGVFSGKGGCHNCSANHSAKPKTK